MSELDYHEHTCINALSAVPIRHRHAGGDVEHAHLPYWSEGSAEGVLQPQGERREDVSGSPPPRPTGTAPSAALPRRKW